MYNISKAEFEYCERMIYKQERNSEDIQYMMQTSFIIWVYMQ